MLCVSVFLGAEPLTAAVSYTHLDLVHMVDLDAAKDGSHANYGVVEQVIRETGATVELGGGIRSCLLYTSRCV